MPRLGAGLAGCGWGPWAGWVLLTGKAESLWADPWVGWWGSSWPPCLVLTPFRLSIRQEKRKKQAEIENKRRQLEDDRRQLQHLKVPGSGLPSTPEPGLAGG